MPENQDNIGSATYSPDDNKLRLYPDSRLDSETYQRVKAAGFAWAPKQELFVAPMWTPSREDLLIELCGEIGDEDISLVDRAEARADRFEDYSDARRSEAESARRAVSSITDGIPMGQPILVGHHSERHARKDAERIENGMRRAVKMWETANYWKSRAAGAIHAAKYKERPDVRARRIKGIESDKRKSEKSRDTMAMWLKLWTDCANEQNAELQKSVAVRLAGMSNLYLPLKDGDKEGWTTRPTAYDALTGSYPNLYAPRTLQEVFDAAQAAYPPAIATCERWIRHFENRLEYERAMLAEAGGLVAERVDIQIGGRVLIGNEWLAVLRVNKSAGQVVSVTTSGRYTGVRGIEEIKDYREPSPEDAAKVKAATKVAPLVNFRADGCLEMTTEQWKKATKWSDWYHVHTFKATETTGEHRQRYKASLNGTDARVFLTDAPVKMPPAAPIVKAEPVRIEREFAQPTEPTPVRTERAPSEFDALREQLRAGVQVVSAPQLFPTPPELATRMVEAAELEPWQTVLEPSAGTGNILRAIEAAGVMGLAVQAVEINRTLAESVITSATVKCADFLTCNGDLGKFDRVLMNPPFENGSDIKHIKHALTMLKPGGRLVAICANGPRQNDALKPLASSWEVLPAGTFAGTGVSAVLLTVEVSA